MTWKSKTKEFLNKFLKNPQPSVASLFDYFLQQRIVVNYSEKKCKLYINISRIFIVRL